MITTIQTAIDFMQTQLTGLYSDSEIRAMTYRTLESVCETNRIAILRGKDKQLSAIQTKRMEDIVADLQKFRPIQYILGETEFFGLPFKVNEHVLIPRPETEELVELIIESGKLRMENDEEWRVKNGELRILDIGTGSGCIAVALVKNFPNAKVYALDISEKALAVAKENAKLNQVNIHFMQYDILNPQTTLDAPQLANAECCFSTLNSRFSIIVSNPPYIVPSEKAEMSANVLNYEPHEALFVSENRPLLFYEAIADFGLQYLEPDGRLFFETGSLFGQNLAEMLCRKGYRNVQLRKDISGNERMISALRPEL
ncbi:MAG: peptide chain release factor N(5)-glutamine methyltransferase [Candidatus Symbiothrix sp.]|jgi:release factor glutamine methyltransferase|nr:peptide chain release factor N(5)-glutamine methyltransferase [Candidatus Symbiothrix sp.]